MENISRSHHYVPQFYLAGFTIDGSIRSKLTVIDKTAQKRFETIPRNVGAERDFNRIDIPGQPIDAVEKALAEFDNQVAGVLKKIANEEVLPNTETEDFSVIMLFIALLGIRNPKLRSNMNSTHEQIGKMMGQQVVATRERWDNAMRQLRESGEDIPEGITYEEMKEFVEEDKYRVTTSNEFNIFLEFSVIPTILPLLFKRNWSLHIAKEDAGEFVASDRPVSIVRNKQLPNELFGPGFGSIQTELAFPLNRNLAVMGTFERCKKRKKAKRQDIANINERTIRLAERHIYYSGVDFYYTHLNNMYRADSLYNA